MLYSHERVDGISVDVCFTYSTMNSLDDTGSRYCAIGDSRNLSICLCRRIFPLRAWPFEGPTTTADRNAPRQYHLCTDAQDGREGRGCLNSRPTCGSCVLSARKQVFSVTVLPRRSRAMTALTATSGKIPAIIFLRDDVYTGNEC